MNPAHDKFGGSTWAASLTIAAAQTAYLKHCPAPSGRVPKGSALHTGVAENGTTTTCQDTALTQAQTDYWRNKLIKFTSGANNGLVRLVTAFNPATDTLTFAPDVPAAVANLDTFELYTAEHNWRIVVTGCVVSGHNTNAAASSVLLRNHATTTAVVLPFTIAPTNGQMAVADGNLWHPLIEDESLQLNVNTLTGQVSLSLKGLFLPASVREVADKYTMDA